MITLIGTRERPYTHAPPGMHKDGMPWGAFCRCSICNTLGCSTTVFDFYGDPGNPLICGNCKGIDHATPESSVAFAKAHPDDCDPIGSGCRGGYVESMGAPL